MRAGFLAFFAPSNSSKHSRSKVGGRPLKDDSKLREAFLLIPQDIYPFPLPWSQPAPLFFWPPCHLLWPPYLQSSFHLPSFHFLFLPYLSLLFPMTCFMYLLFSLLALPLYLPFSSLPPFLIPPALPSPNPFQPSLASITPQCMVMTSLLLALWIPEQTEQWQATEGQIPKSGKSYRTVQGARGEKEQKDKNITADRKSY